MSGLKPAHFKEHADSSSRLAGRQPEKKMRHIVGIALLDRRFHVPLNNSVQTAGPHAKSAKDAKELKLQAAEAIH